VPSGRTIKKLIRYSIDCNNLEAPDISNEQVTIIEQTEYNSSEIRYKLRKYFMDNHLEDKIKDKIIMLKVSLVFAVKKYERVLMINTNYHLIAGTAGALEDLGAKKIWIADGDTIGKAWYAYRTTKLKKYIKPMRLTRTEFLYLDEVPQVHVEFENSPIENLSLNYPTCLISDKKLIDNKSNIIDSNKLLSKYGYIDYFISMPKLKANIFADITLSVKNNMGLITRADRLKYHGKTLHDMIACLYTIRPPDLVITDAVVSGMGQGPMEADPAKTEMLIIGNVGTAVDTVCNYLMDHDPLTVKHLKKLKDLGFGTLNIDKIKVVNKSTLDVKRSKVSPFAMPDSDFTKIPGITAYIGKNSCQPGCLGMMKAIVDGYAHNRNPKKLKGVTFIIGDVDITEEQLQKINKRKCVIYGDCAAKKYKGNGHCYKGCPPDYLYAMLFMQLPFLGGMGINPWVKYINVQNYFWSYIRHAGTVFMGVKRSRNVNK
jgi:uncharacterized protein (DUF362 family)